MNKSVFCLLFTLCVLLPATFANERSLRGSSDPSFSVQAPDNLVGVDPSKGDAYVLEPGTTTKAAGQTVGVFDKGDKFGVKDGAAYVNYDGGNDLNINNGQLATTFGNAKADPNSITATLPSVTSVNGQARDPVAVTIPLSKH